MSTATTFVTTLSAPSGCLGLQRFRGHKLQRMSHITCLEFSRRVVEIRRPGERILLYVFGNKGSDFFYCYGEHTFWARYSIVRCIRKNELRVICGARAAVPYVKAMNYRFCCCAGFAFFAI